jgi:TIR domain-containing protein
MWFYDLFISHASEDKDALVRPLAEALKAAHVEVWYDEFELRVGDSLRRMIDRGLTRSRFAVVVLSRSFFAKNWPQRELDGLVAREMIGNDRVVLPVWHGVSKEDVLNFSPLLADVLAIDSAVGIESLTSQIMKVVRPRTSPLVVARDYLLENGITPPVVTDEWWLNVVEASHREYPWGFVPHMEHWGRWSFPLPGYDGESESRGERIAWTAMQMVWAAEAKARPVTQITQPEEVLEFINSQPGLAEMCHQYPNFLASYAPQLTIADFGGSFEDDFDWLLKRSAEDRLRQARTNPRGTKALTTDESRPGCDCEIALRHPSFGSYEPATLACQFVQGESGGPPAKHFETIDYVAWFLSDSSSWMPSKIRTTLTRGLADWSTWWWDSLTDGEHELGLISYEGRGELLNAMASVEDDKEFKMTKACQLDLVRRLDDSCHLIGLNENGDELSQRFLEAGFVEAFFESRCRRNRGQEIE